MFFVYATDVDSYLGKYRPIQLRDKITVAVNSAYPATSFGDSKGLTFERILIYPTKPMTDWIFNNTKILPPQSRARLYVAVTRAQYSVAIVINNKLKSKVDGVKIWERGN